MEGVDHLHAWSLSLWKTTMPAAISYQKSSIATWATLLQAQRRRSPHQVATASAEEVESSILPLQGEEETVRMMLQHIIQQQHIQQVQQHYKQEGKGYSAKAHPTRRQH
eukprot:1924693-Amphidinium_carterae.2